MALKHRQLGIRTMQKSQLKGDKKSRGFQKQQPHRHFDIDTMQKSHSNLT